MKARVFNFFVVVGLTLLGFRAPYTRADLPLERLSDGIKELASLPEEALIDLFKNGEAPQRLPEGRALGYHLVEKDRLYRAPLAHYLAVKTIWHAKTFKNLGTRTIMIDDTVLPNGLEPLKANVFLGSARSVLMNRYENTNEDYIDDTLDAENSLITDYYTWSYPQILHGLMAPFKPWFDEYRLVDPAQPRLWIGRSYYNGRFWGWLFIDFDT